MVKPVAFPVMCRLFWIRERLRRRRVIVYCKYPGFVRKSEALADLLRRRGFRAAVRTGMSFSTRALLKSSPDLWIGFWNKVPLEFLPKNYILWNAEPLDRQRVGTGVGPRLFAAMKNAREVWGYTRSNQEHAAILGVLFHFVPFGYAPHYESTFREHIEGKNLEQDIDVLFFGAMSARRQRALDALKLRGMKVHVVSSQPMYGGEEFDELLARSKIVIGIHYYDELEAQIPDLARVDHLLSNRRFVVHERPSVSDSAFEQYVTTCEYDEIPDTCAHFLARPEERARKAAAAYEWFKSEYELDAFVPYDDLQHLAFRTARRSQLNAAALPARSVASDRS